MGNCVFERTFERTKRIIKLQVLRRIKMSTRSVTHFMYRHADGYAEGHGTDLYKFLQEVMLNVRDNRFTDPGYLAAKLVVWLANKFNKSYNYKTQKWSKNKSRLGFLGVGVMNANPGDEEYIYEIYCDRLNKYGYPEFNCFEAGSYRVIPVPKPKGFRFKTWHKTTKIQRKVSQIKV
jgi:hypothetical protein